jgi:serine phosphatase RsbU (regulator of sigma subunit)
VVSPTIGWMAAARPSAPLGIAPFRAAAAATVALEPDWAMLLMTDGVYEVKGPNGRLGMESFVEIVRTIDGWSAQPAAALDALVREVSGGDPSGLDDDVALVWLGCAP